MNQEILNQLNKLKADTQEVILLLSTNPEARREAVNWRAVNCYTAEKVTDEDGNEFFRVWIDECSPEAVNFQQLVRTALLERNWQNVRVHTEW